MALGLARFMRNLVPGLPWAQSYSSRNFSAALHLLSAAPLAADGLQALAAFSTAPMVGSTEQMEEPTICSQWAPSRFCRQHFEAKKDVGSMSQQRGQKAKELFNCS